MFSLGFNSKELRVSFHLTSEYTVLLFWGPFEKSPSGFSQSHVTKPFRDVDLDVFSVDKDLHCQVLQRLLDVGISFRADQAFPEHFPKFTSTIVHRAGPLVLLPLRGRAHGASLCCVCRVRRSRHCLGGTK